MRAVAQGGTSSFLHEGPRVIFVHHRFVLVDSSTHVCGRFGAGGAAERQPASCVTIIAARMQQGTTEARWAVHFFRLARVYRALRRSAFRFSAGDDTTIVQFLTSLLPSWEL
jgi:hypothetical protein